jgi:predicted transcriptional regulator
MANRRRPKTPRPTEAELEILRVLWQRGSSTVREVQEALNAERPTGYTTVLKLMQIMTEKRLLVRDERRPAHIYRPRVPAEKTQQQLVADLLDRAFEGSADKLVMHALSVKPVSQQELAQIRALLDKIEGERQ